MSPSTQQADRSHQNILADVLGSLGSGLFIDGEWRSSAEGKEIAVTNPATGAELHRIVDASSTDAEAAITAADRAQARWANTPARERGEILRRAFEMLTERAEEVATLIAAEMGKSLSDARAEVTYGAEFFRWFSEEAARITGDLATAPDGSTTMMVSRRPVGPAIIITPWNFPLAMATRKIGAALAAGCTVVYKPAKLTPLTSLLLCDVLTEAGLPKGVLNMAVSEHASTVTQTWIDSGKARKLSFTGSTEVGRSLLESCAPQVLRTSMELGGNAPFVVCADADLDQALDAAMVAKMRNTGEACTAANRFIVHESLAETFAERLAERMRAMRIGNQLDPEVEVGPLVEESACTKVAELVSDALARGATALCGGPDAQSEVVAQHGPLFYPPTVLHGVSSDARVMQEEIFGPVAPIVSFTDDEEAIALANGTEFGLVAYLFTSSLARATALSARLESGMIGLNTGLVSNPAAPFGGIKQSGLGREGGRLGIDEYLEYTYLAMPKP